MATWQGQCCKRSLWLCRADPNPTASPRVLTMTSLFGAISGAGALATVCSCSDVPSSRPCRPLGWAALGWLHQGAVISTPWRCHLQYGCLLSCVPPMWRLGNTEIGISALKPLPDVLQAEVVTTLRCHTLWIKCVPEFCSSMTSRVLLQFRCAMREMGRKGSKYT